VPVALVTRLWLLGEGVQQSPSPAMQNAALRYHNLSLTYETHDVSPQQLPAAVAALRSGEVAGANVTIPYKRAVATQCDELVGDALLTGAVNTVVVRNGRLVGHNTDADGLNAALRHDGLQPAEGAAVVVLGAGGAAAAALLALSRSRPLTISVVARRREAADSVAAQLRPHIPLLAAGEWDAEWVRVALGVGGSSVLVNATPAPLAALPVDVDALPQACAVVDLRYRPRPVDLVAAAQARGLRAADGLEMLLQQGMLSFAMWTGQPPPWDVARKALHEAVGV
jgi:shikimate dehydrogenase